MLRGGSFSYEQIWRCIFAVKEIVSPIARSIDRGSADPYFFTMIPDDRHVEDVRRMGSDNPPSLLERARAFGNSTAGRLTLGVLGLEAAVSAAMPVAGSPETPSVQHVRAAQPIKVLALTEMVTRQGDVWVLPEQAIRESSSGVEVGGVYLAPKTRFERGDIAQMTHKMGGPMDIGVFANVENNGVKQLERLTTPRETLERFGTPRDSSQEVL